MPDSQFPRPDLFLAAMGRSGSTMLANLLTTPPDRWLLVEPRFANATTGRDLLDQARSFGFEVAADEWSLRPGESPQARITRVFGDRIRGLGKWGLKEVRHDLLLPTLETLHPHRTIVLVRDIRDVAVSLHEKTVRDANPKYDDVWLRGYLTETPASILAIADAVAELDHRVVRYEDFVSSPDLRSEVANWLDWPLDGQPDRNLASVFQRGREVELHEGRVTQRALARHLAPGLSAAARDLAAWAHNAAREFQARFDYV